MATQFRPINSAEEAKAPIRQTTDGIFDQPYQEKAYDPAIGGGGSTFTYAANGGLYGTYNTLPGANSIQIGKNADSNGGGFGYNVAIGYNAEVAIGPFGVGALAIGHQAKANAYYGEGVALGASTKAYGSRSVAIGRGARTDAYCDNSIAIGRDSRVNSTHGSSVAIGWQVQTTGTEQFMIGISPTLHMTFDTWTPSVSAATPSTHILPILIGGTRYNILLSNV